MDEGTRHAASVNSSTAPSASRVNTAPPLGATGDHRRIGRRIGILQVVECNELRIVLV